LVLLRISGRRSFGLRTPLDNIIALQLGAILSRAVVGVSPFVPVIGACFVIVLLHRSMAWLVVHNEKISTLLQGDKILLFEQQKLIKKNMDKALVSEKDIYYALRKTASAEDLGKISKMYMEHNGEISLIKDDK
jgi:uncharacterized membrane protein YcaP (DUF421 family)